MITDVYWHSISTAGPGFIFIAQAYADVADYDVGGLAKADFLIFERNAVARGGLPGDGESCVFDLEGRFKLDSAWDLEDYGARAAGRLDPLAERPRARGTPVWSVWPGGPAALRAARPGSGPGTKSPGWSINCETWLDLLSFCFLLYLIQIYG